jgi:signal transduction histidine kinase
VSIVNIRGSYPRDIGAIATIFIVLILFIAAFNLYINFQFRSEFDNYDRANIIAIANLCRGYVNQGYYGKELSFLLRNLEQSFSLQDLAVTDTLGNSIYDSRAKLNVPFGITSTDYLERFERLPGPQEMSQEANHFVFHGVEPALYIYVSLAPSYSVVFGDIFRWHIFYITISLVFTGFLGLFLLRNLFLPMRYVSNLAQDFGIEMKKEDFVSATFGEVYRKLKLREQMLMEFSSYIAHEFRNSLGAIIGLARLVEKGKKPAADIVDECRSMEELIARILEYSKPLKLNITSVDLNKVLEDALARTGVPKRIQVLHKSTADISAVKGDHELLCAAVANLLKNAKEAIKGKGTIEVETGEADNLVFLVVKDDGMGMDSEETEMIFNPFFSRKADGMGLGLAYVKRIIEEHNGRIEVVSERHMGSVFTLRFPRLHK